MSSLSPPSSSTTRARSSSTAGNLTQARSRAATSAASPSAPSQQQSSADGSDRKPPADQESPSKPAAAKMLNVLLTMSRVITQDALQQLPTANSASLANGAAAPPLFKADKNSVDLTAGLGGKVVSWENEKKAAQSLLAAGGAIADRAADLVQQQQRRGQQAQQQRTRLPPPSIKPRRGGHKRQPSPFSSLFISPPSPLPPPAVSSPRALSFARFSPSGFHLPHLPSSSSSRPASPSSPATTASSLVPPPRILLPLFFVCSLFFITLLPIVIGIWTLPLHSIKHLPRTIQDIKQVARELNEYASSGPSGTAHIFAVLAVTSIWKNAWSMPGSAVLNVLAGALMNPLVATLLQTLLTTIGSICSSLLSKPLAPVIAHVFPRAMSLTRSAFEGTTFTPVQSPAGSPRGSVDDDDAPVEETEKLLESSPASTSPALPSPSVSQQKPQTPIWVRLTVLRLVGVVPWSALNLACGICDVPLWDCAIGGFIGMLPWTAVTCQIGDILSTVASSSSDEAGQTLSSMLTSPSIIFKLVFLSLLSLGPVLLRDKLSELLSSSKKTNGAQEKKKRRSSEEYFDGGSGSSTAYEEDLEEAEFEVREKI